VLDDDRRETMPAIGNRSYARSLPRTPPIQQPVFLTMPCWSITRNGSWLAAIKFCWAALLAGFRLSPAEFRRILDWFEAAGSR